MPTTKRGKMFKEIFMTEMKIRDSFKGKTKWPRNDMRQCHSIQKKKRLSLLFRSGKEMEITSQIGLIMMHIAKRKRKNRDLTFDDGPKGRREPRDLHIK